MMMINSFSLRLFVLSFFFLDFLPIIDIGANKEGGITKASGRSRGVKFYRKRKIIRQIHDSEWNFTW